MAKKKAKTAEQPKTTAQQLGSLIKSARDIMRKDKGLNGDLDRLPLLTWIMFLKFLDDREKLEEARASIGGKKYKSAIEAPYRWRDWATNKAGITGDELIAFVNQDEAVRPDGKRGVGLLAYLRKLQSTNGDRRRDVIATVFDGIINRMISGYLLRDVINLVDGIHFDSSEEIHTLARLYESMLREMRDAAGDSGEFYTPRPVIQFMVAVTDPKLGEVVLDPACGTGGFLAESFAHFAKQCKTVQDRKSLQEKSIRGGEAKPLPYMLSQMNLLLHGLDAPAIDYGNSLAVKITEIGPSDQVDVILTNPPFGGEEERGILSNFPTDKQTAETAILFLQLIMRMLRRPTTARPTAGRAAVVVSDGLLSTKGVHSRVKQQLLNECNLHTIIRLPRGVFSPYTPIKTNLLFFDRGTPTKGVWFYEMPQPTDRQMYTKTKPILASEFEPCLQWWKKRKKSECAWYVPVEELEKREFDLDVTNPNRAPDAAKSEPVAIFHTIEKSLQSLQSGISHLEQTLRSVPMTFTKEKPRQLSTAITLRKEFVTISDDEQYRLVTVQLHGRGLKLRSVTQGQDIRTKKQQVLRDGELVVAEIDAKMGGFGIVPSELVGAIVSSHYFIYTIDESRLDRRFLDWFLKSGLAEAWIQPFVKGSTNYASIRQNHFPLLDLRLPDLKTQQEFVERLGELGDHATELATTAKLLHAELDALIPSILFKTLNHKS